MKKTSWYFIFLVLLIFGCSDRCPKNIPNPKHSNMQSVYIGSDVQIFCGTQAQKLVYYLHDGNYKKAEEELQKNPDLINYRKPAYENSILTWSVINDNEECVRFLLQNNAEVNNPNLGNVYPLEYAARSMYSCESNILELLLERTQKKSSLKERKIINNSLVIASRKSCLRNVRLLVERGKANINYQGQVFSTVGGPFKNSKTSPLISAAVHEEFDNLEYLLSLKEVDLDKHLFISGLSNDILNLKQLLGRKLQGSHSRIDSSTFTSKIKNIIEIIDKRSLRVMNNK